MKVFGLQAPVYRGASLSSRLTAQTSQLAAIRRDALERWRRVRSRGLSAEEAARAVGTEPGGLALPLGGSPETGMSQHQIQRSPIRFKGRADPSHIYLNPDSGATASPRVIQRTAGVGR
jgi:hypothetical protein